MILVPTKEGTDISVGELGFSTRKEWYNKYYIKTEHWKQKTKENYEYFHGTCMWCGRKIDKGVMHHLNYKHLWNEVPGRDVVLYCNKCHHKNHHHEKAKSKWFEETPVATEYVSVMQQVFNGRKVEEAPANLVSISSDLSSLLRAAHSSKRE
jgi:hypothetical protein